MEGAAKENRNRETSEQFLIGEKKGLKTDEWSVIRYITLFRFLGGRCGPTQPSLFGHGDSYVVY
jgi:hypothetical protein